MANFAFKIERRHEENVRTSSSNVNRDPEIRGFELQRMPTHRPSTGCN